MGFDNECILNIQSLAGEYFCPVCRLLVYPNEALQSQCTHLYCKPCLTYVVGTTKACPYDGYLVTEADSKPLVESNKTLAETIGKIAVHCLYHRSGCTWQGELSECINHCGSCAFGNSPVVCNRCGTQIVHRQVQEHAQNCPGVQPQAQQADGSQATTTAAAAVAVTATSGQNQTAVQAGVPASQAQVAQIAVAPTSGQDQIQGNTNSQPQVAVQAVPTPEQLHQQQQQQQQYQQYYQQNPGYDPYQQQYQQYGSYQQQAYPQYQQQGSLQQPQMYMQPQPQSQVQLSVQPQPQAQSQSHPQPQAQVQLPPQGQTQAPIHAQPQAQVGVQSQVQPQGNIPNQLQPSYPHPQMQPQPPQLYSQAPSHQQPHPPQPQLQTHIQQRPQVAQHQPTVPQPQHQTHPYLQQQSVAQTQAQAQAHPQSQVQPYAHVQVQPQMQPQAQPLAQHQMPPQHPSSHAVTGHQSYPQPLPNQQMPPGASQMQSIPMQPQQQGASHQLPQQTQTPIPQQQLAQMRPPQSQVPMQQQQQQAMVPPQNQLPNVPPAQQPVPTQPNQPIHQYSGMHLPLQQNMSQQLVHGQSLHPQAFPGQTPGLVQNTPQQPAPYIQQQPMQPQLRSPVPQLPLPPAPQAQQQLQQNVSLSHGFQSQVSQSYGARPMLQNHGVPRQPFQPSPVGLAGSSHAKMQSSGVQQYPPRPNTQAPSSAEQQFGGFMHRSGIPQSANEAFQVSSSPAPQEHTNMKPKSQDERASHATGLKGANMLPTTLSQGSRLTESNGKPENERRPESELKYMGGDNNSVNEGENTGNHSKLARKESSESSQALDKNPVSSTQEALDEPVVKNTVKEETIGKSESSVGLAETAVQNKEVIPHISQKQDGHSQPEDKEAQDDSGNLSRQLTGSLDGKDGKVPSDTTQLQGNVASRGKIHMNGEALSLQEKNMLQHHNLRQDQAHQVPAISDQMSLQNRHPNQMQVRPSTHMRPQGHSIHGNVPPQGHPLSAPPHFQQPIAKQPRGSLQTEVYPGAVVGPATFGSGPGPLGPQGHPNTGQMLPHHAVGPRMQGDSVGRPTLGGPPPGIFNSQAGTIGRFHPHSQQIPSAPLDSEFNANKIPGYYDGKPDFHMHGPPDRVPFAQPSNMQSDMIKMHGGSSRGMSGGSSDPSYQIGLQGERFKHFPEDGYRQYPEGFNLPGEERRSGFSVEQGRHTVNSREFFDDLKQFPRPTHLDAEHVPKSENYFSSSRPLDRAPHSIINDPRVKFDASASASAVASRLPPPSQASGLRPIDSHDDISGRKIHPDFHRSVPESGRLRMDGYPPFRSPGREFSDIPPTRFGRIDENDGRESRAFGERSKPFNLHSDNNPFPERKFPGLSNLRREEFDVPGNLRIGERIRPMGEDLVGPNILPRHLRSGGPVGPRSLQMVEPGGFGSYPNNLRLGDVGGPGSMPIGGTLPSHSRPSFNRGIPNHGYGSDAGIFNTGEMESLDHTRKRKHGSNGWCRICKVDCETVEGLELHSQTREHQKMAMDMVLNIKKDNAKKHKIASDEHMSHEGNTNKTRKAIVESHGN